MLKVNNLYLSFSGLEATNNISLEVKRNKITALIGPNGAGKTTLFNLIAGIYTPSSGTIIFDGKDITYSKPYQISEFGISRTYQVIKLFNKMSVLENVMVGMHNFYNTNFFDDIFHTRKMKRVEEENKKNALEILRFVGLEKYLDYTAESLSYGQQRLLEIARALASKPKLLLLDEPAAGMNSKEKNDLKEMMNKIISTGISILVVEHDMSLVMNVADYIYVINSGKNLAEGTPDEISNNDKVIEAYLGSKQDE